MRKFLFICACMLPLAILAQPTGVYTEVVKLDSSYSANKLFSNALSFLAVAVKDSKSAIENSDRESKTIHATINNPITRPMAAYGYVSFSAIIECKDGRYKYTLKDFFHQQLPGAAGGSGGSLLNKKPDCGTLKMPMGWWEDVKNQNHEAMERFIASMKAQMAKKNDDW